MLLVFVEVCEFGVSEGLEGEGCEIGGEGGVVGANVIEEVGVINCFEKNFSPSRTYSSKRKCSGWFFRGKLY